MNTFRQVCASFALATVLTLASTAVVVADPPAGKGKDRSAQSGGYEQHGQKGQESWEGEDGRKGKDGDDGRYDDDKDNHGSVVSECNHRANERNLKGQERKQWTEWCESRGSRHKYDYTRYSKDRNCYQKADNKGLTGDKRRKFINDCLDIPNRY